MYSQIFIRTLLFVRWSPLAQPHNLCSKLQKTAFLALTASSKDAQCSSLASSCCKGVKGTIRDFITVRYKAIIKIGMLSPAHTVSVDFKYFPCLCLKPAAHAFQCMCFLLSIRAAASLLCIVRRNCSNAPKLQKTQANSLQGAQMNADVS